MDYSPRLVKKSLSNVVIDNTASCFERRLNSNLCMSADQRDPSRDVRMGERASKCSFYE